MKRKTTWEKPTLVRLASGASAEVGSVAYNFEGTAGGEVAYFPAS